MFNEWLLYRLSTLILVLALITASIPGTRRGVLLQWSHWIFTVAVIGFLTTVVVRWRILGHGPFLSMYEILLSNLLSLGVVALLVMQMYKPAREVIGTVLIVLSVLAVWGLGVSDRATVLPPTYDNPWLWVHVGFGKPFLGLLLVSTGMAVRQLLTLVRTNSPPSDWPEAIVTWKLFSAAFLFESLMLIAGAVWARDAWGRYWQWDPLETWAFLTWIMAAVVLHLKVTKRIPEIVALSSIIVVFAVAFLTFFGFPFLSPAPHKGAV